MTKSNRILVLFAVLGLSVNTMFAQEIGVVINGVTWATRNVDMPGTLAENPEDAGMFYQWNREVGWSNTDPLINSNGTSAWITQPSTEAESWETENDPCPEGWRVPTIGDFQLLMNTTYVTSTWTVENGVKGMNFTDIANSNSIFLPAAGNRGNSNGALWFSGTAGYYWSSTLVNGTNGAHLMGFSGKEAPHSGSSSLGIGYCVRCVKDGGDVGINEVSTDTEN